MRTLDLILMIACLVTAVVMLAGKGEKLITDQRSVKETEQYNMKKVQRGYGLALLITGIATGINSQITSQAGHVIYLIVVLTAFAGSVVYRNQCCKK